MSRSVSSTVGKGVRGVRFPDDSDDIISTLRLTPKHRFGLTQKPFKNGAIRFYTLVYLGTLSPQDSVSQA